MYEYVNRENVDLEKKKRDEAEKVGFVLGLLGFLSVVFSFTILNYVLAPILTGIGLYYSILSKKKSVIVMNVFALIASIVLIYYLIYQILNMLV